MTDEDFRAFALALPEVMEGFNMGSVVFKANGKVLARLLGGGQAMLVGMDFDARDLMLEAQPEVFHITPHYKDYRGVIATLALFGADQCRSLLEQRWREIMPRKIAASYDAAKG